jgi:hypothetical protein
LAFREKQSDRLPQRSCCSLQTLTHLSEFSRREVDGPLLDVRPPDAPIQLSRPLPVNQARNLPLDLGDFLGPLASAALRWNVIEGRSAPAESKQVQE